MDQVEQNDAILLNNHQEKVAMFDSNRSKVGNSDISLPISNPEVFSGDSAEKSPKKKSSWDTLNAYNKGEK